MAYGGPDVSFIDSLIETDRTQPKRILVLGDGILDVYVNGRLEPCQDGCNKFVEEERFSVAGGAANAARSLQQWSAKCTFFYNDTHRPVKTRFLCGGRCVFRHDTNEGGRNGSDEDPVIMVTRARVLRHVRLNLSDAVLLSDYDKGFLTPEFIRQVIDACKDREIPVVADAKRDPSVYAGAVLKCNSDYQHRNNQQLSDLVYDDEGGQKLVVTSGPLNPVAWLGDGSRPFGLGYWLPPVQCVNHVGAGDCFAAHLTLALAYGLALRDAVAFAHSAGRVYVQHPHNRPPWPEEIKRDLELKV